MSAKIIDGRKIGANIREKVTLDIEKLKDKHGVFPNITTVKIGDNPESNLYLKLRDKACEKVGINSNHLVFDTDVSELEVLENIHRLNSDNEVHGVLIQMPLPKHISHHKLINVLKPDKDVEGFTPTNLGNTLLGMEQIVPCTPLAVLKILEFENIDLKGKDVVIVNHSTVVGKPLAVLFLNRNSSVSVAHVFTKDLIKYSTNADVLVSAAGIPRLITASHIKKGCFVIDVGIIKTEEGVCGDVDMDSVKEVAGELTPVPGGVGPVTIACSLVNMVKTFKICIGEKQG